MEQCRCQELQRRVADLERKHARLFALLLIAVGSIGAEHATVLLPRLIP